MEACSFIFSLSVPCEYIKGETQALNLLEFCIMVHEEQHLSHAFAANRWFLNFILEQLFCSK